MAGVLQWLPLLVTLPSVTLTCSPVNNEWTVYPLQDLVYLAPVVAVGRVLSLNDTTNQGKFQLLCVLKWDQQHTQSQITVQDVVFVDSCTNREPWRLGETWLAMLERSGAIFNFFEPDIHNQGAQAASDDNLQMAADVCGVEVQTVAPPGEDYVCPVTNATAQSCYATASAPRLIGSLLGVHCLMGLALAAVMKLWL